MIDKKDRKSQAIQQAGAKKKKIITFTMVVAIVLTSGAAWYISHQNALAEQQQAQAKKELDEYLATTTAGAELIIQGEQEYAIQSREHIGLRQSHAAYTTNPPTSGPHASAERGGFYANEIPDEMAVHNLEHGFIWISYKNIPENQVLQIRALAKDNPGRLIASKRVKNDTDGVILASWGKMLTLSRYDETLAKGFIKRNVNKSPERLAL
jgi:hypothetical protein